MLYEHIILLDYFIKHNSARDVIRLIEEWIKEKHSLIEYFCSSELIDKSLESIIISYKKDNIGIDQFVVEISEERLMLIRNGMDDKNIR